MSNANFTDTGNLGSDPRVYKTPSGTTIVKFSIATDGYYYKNVDGQRVRQSTTTWVPVVLFGSQADIAERFLQKGSSVLVQGRLENDVYEIDGEKRQQMVVRGSYIRPLARLKTQSENLTE